MDIEQCITLNLVQCVTGDLYPNNLKILKIFRYKIFYYQVQNEVPFMGTYDMIFDFSGSTKSTLKLACISHRFVVKIK